MNLFRMLSLWLSSFAMTGCATLFAPKEVPILVTSHPEGAAVLVNDVYVGQTPLEVYVENSRSQLVTVSPSDDAAANDEAVDCYLGTSLKPKWIFFNVLAGIWPIFVDAASTRWNELDHRHCHIDFEP